MINVDFSLDINHGNWRLLQALHTVVRIVVCVPGPQAYFAQCNRF